MRESLRDRVRLFIRVNNFSLPRMVWFFTCFLRESVSTIFGGMRLRGDGSQSVLDVAADVTTACAKELEVYGKLHDVRVKKLASEPIRDAFCRIKAAAETEKDLLLIQRHVPNPDIVHPGGETAWSELARRWPLINKEGQPMAEGLLMTAPVDPQDTPMSGENPADPAEYAVFMTTGLDRVELCRVLFHVTSAAGVKQTMEERCKCFFFTSKIVERTSGTPGYYAYLVVGHTCSQPEIRRHLGKKWACTDLLSFKSFLADPGVHLLTVEMVTRKVLPVEARQAYLSLKTQLMFRRCRSYLRCPAEQSGSSGQCWGGEVDGPVGGAVDDRPVQGGSNGGGNRAAGNNSEVDGPTGGVGGADDDRPVQGGSNGGGNRAAGNNSEVESRAGGVGGAEDDDGSVQGGSNGC
eukprot:GHVU01151682.1.p1 GENE.GHVU01151682.1~~GHVU01151682.1.p1  ORF type:complete len:450 (+),score=36.36 GHVU01151682.1:132-1352(+)